MGRSKDTIADLQKDRDGARVMFSKRPPREFKSLVLAVKRKKYFFAL